MKASQYVDQTEYDNIIVRHIEFPPEYRQAGLGIINYFSEIVHQKYPDIPVYIRIKQEDLTVRMVIETPEGHRDIVERTLETYGLIISGKMQPSDLLTNQFHILALENKLELTKIELRMTQQHFQIAERYNEQQQNRITALETEVTGLRQLVGESLAVDT